MYHLAKKYHPLYLEKMNEELSLHDDSTAFDKGGKYKSIFNNLITTVKQCQQKYGGTTKLATEQDDLIVKLCDAWEEAVSYGIKAPQFSVLKNVQEMVSGHNVSQPNFWEFCQKHLTNHEKERFEGLRNVWTSRGKTKALIRAAFNERSLERYVLMWLSDPTLALIFEPWSLMLNKESSNLLPSMAAGLSSILFAVAVDTPDINVTRTGVKKTEPIVFAPAPVGPSKKKTAVKRQIVSLDDAKEQNRNSIETLDTAIEEEVCNINDDNDDIAVIEHSLTAGSEDSAVDVLEHFEISQRRNSEASSSTHTHLLDEENILKVPTPSVNNISMTSDISSESSSYFSRQSSLRSSICSASSKMTLNQMEQKLKEVTEKCIFLEARVAELSLENRRLHRLMNHSSGNENWQFLVSIPRANLIKSGTKPYYAYEIYINFTNSSDTWVVLRRYSEFYKLHQKVKKNNALIKALDFPPKKKIGNMDIAFVEERRQRLQIYLRHLLAVLPEVSNCTTKSELQAAFPFLVQ